MAKGARRRLKVFQAHIGFYDTVVATPSQAAALRAWGVHQDLFAAGQARIADDPQAIEAALAHPDTPLRRPVGSSDAFAIEPSGLPDVPDAPKTRPRAPTRAPPKEAPRPAADRSALDTAEAELERLEEDRKREEAALRRKQDELDVERDTARKTYLAARNAATAAVANARRLYREAGGTD